MAGVGLKSWVILNSRGFMDTNNIVSEIDAEISRLHQVRALLTGTSTTAKRKPGRPTGASLPKKTKAVRTLSAEAREKIAAAQRGRWSKSRKAAKKEVRNAAAVPAAKKASTASLPVTVNTKAVRSLSAEAREKIAAAQKARWAKVRKGAKKGARNAAAPAAKANGLVPKTAPAGRAVSVKKAAQPKTKTLVTPAA
jgi:hypothetical protein